MTAKEYDKIKEIIDKFIPEPKDDMLCHNGFQGGKVNCGRCSDAVTIRVLIKSLKRYIGEE